MKFPGSRKPLTLKTAPPAVALGAYSCALKLYPNAFRQRYREQMMHAAQLELEQSHDIPRSSLGLAWDLVKSLPREHWHAATPANPIYAAAVAVFFSAIMLALSVARQQDLRRKADLRPLRAVARIADGADPAPFLAGESHEIATDNWLNRPGFFVALYNDAGQPIASNATLHGVLPQPPPGIFRYARARGLNKVSWQPETGVRVATVLKPLPAGGFVLAGESLIVSETQEGRLNRLLFWMWLTMLAAVAGIGFLTRLRHSAKPV
jgi:hypothetical protein